MEKQNGRYVHCQRLKIKHQSDVTVTSFPYLLQLGEKKIKRNYHISKVHITLHDFGK